MKTRVGLLAAFLATALTGTACASRTRTPEHPLHPPDENRMPFVTFTGPNSRIEEPTWLRITTPEEFHPLYLRHVGLKPEDFYEKRNPHGVPLVDFERCMVVAVFGGKGWNSDGLYVKEVVDDGHRLVVRYDDRSYQTAGPDGGGVRVTPYGLFVLPRRDKELVVEENVQPYIGHPPKWQERARFPAKQ